MRRMNEGGGKAARTSKGGTTFLAVSSDGSESLFSSSLENGRLDLGAVVLSDAHTLHEFKLRSLLPDKDVAISFYVEPPSLAEQIGFQLENENLLADMGEE